jgi:hypothetical protein
MRPVLRAGGRGHGGSGLLGQLDDVPADRAARAVDQDALPCLQAGVLEERLPGRQPGRGQRRGVGQSDRVRGGGQRPGGRGDVLGGRAGRGHRQERHHRVPGAPAADPLADLGDDAGHVEVRDVREGHREHLLQETGADRDVHRVERGAGHLHHHLPRSCGRAVGVLVDQDVAVAVGVVTHCFHDLSSLGASKLKHMETITRFDFEAIHVGWVTFITCFEFATCTVEK